MTPIFKTIALGSDHAGFQLKEVATFILKELGLKVEDVGTFDQTSVDYPLFANRVANMVLEKKVEVGLLICGTGIGMSMAANRYHGIRAAVCNMGPTEARLARAHNNANILCLGERLMGIELFKDTIISFMTTPFDGGERHQKRINLLG